MSHDLFSAFSSEELEAGLQDKLSRSLLDAIPVPVAILAAHNKGEHIDAFVYVFTNRAAQNKPTEAEGKQILAGDDERLFNNMTAVAKTGKPIDFVHHYESGEKKWVHHFIFRFGNGILLTSNDITEKKNLEEKLKSAKEKLRDIQDNDTERELKENANFIQSMASAMADILYIMDIDSKHIKFATSDIIKKMGYTQEQAEQMEEPFFDIMYAPDIALMVRHIDDMKHAGDGEVREIEYRMVHADGSLRWFLDRNTIIKRNGDGIPYEKLGITQDIMQKKESEEQIHLLNQVLKEKNRELRSLSDELKTFNSVAAFDYKNTLQNLYTNLEYIITRDAANLSNPGKANLRKAQTGIQKMKLLTDDIVAFSRIQTMDSNPTTVNLNEILKSVVSELSERIKETGGEADIQELPVINGYPFLLTLLFYHLLDNSIKFRKMEEKLLIRIHHDIVEKPGGDLHRISVIDNGIGFSTEEADKVFLMFHRLHDKKFKGSGIGLAIARKITNLHGGTIAAESESGHGTTICCFFPIL